MYAVCFVCGLQNMDESYEGERDLIPSPLELARDTFKCASKRSTHNTCKTPWPGELNGGSWIPCETTRMPSLVILTFLNHNRILIQIPLSFLSTRSEIFQESPIVAKFAQWLGPSKWSNPKTFSPNPWHLPLGVEYPASMYRANIFAATFSSLDWWWQEAKETIKFQWAWRSCTVLGLPVNQKMEVPNLSRYMSILYIITHPDFLGDSDSSTWDLEGCNCWFRWNICWGWPNQLRQQGRKRHIFHHQISRRKKGMGILLLNVLSLRFMWDEIQQG